MDRASMPSQFQLYSLDLTAMKSQLQLAPLDTQGIISDLIISFPNPNGQFENYRVYESPVMEAGLANRYQDIKTYSGTSIEDPTASIHFSTTIFGLHFMSLSAKFGTFYIDTYTKNLNNYIVYSKKDIKNNRNFGCFTNDDLSSKIAASDQFRVNDGRLRQYRLAIACTVEYSQFHLAQAGTPGSATLAQKKAVVLAAMVVSMTRLNGVYGREMAIRMNLVANNDLVIFIDTDNFTNSPTMINEIQPIMDAAIGSANYDMGHGFCTTDSGIAQLASICGTGKARGITGQASPVGDPFDINYVAHEMGHQFGATHTQNNNCNRTGSSAFEPGSASTIMGYAGICAPNVQTDSDDHFHAISILQMTSFVVGASTCGTSTLNNNIAPVVNAGANFIIPTGTAFILKGAATDANNDALTYCWEQYNNEVSTQPPTQSATTGPNFRSLPPNISPNRFMPRFSDVLLGNLAPTWEVVPNVARTMTFALTVRDNRTGGGMTNRADMTVTTASVGPFQITSPNVENVSWAVNSSQNITWDVAGTTANGINTANVNILFSTNGGATFSTLVANTPNDGAQTITAPSSPFANCRIMIEAVGNIFYAVSKNIAVGFVFTNSCTTYNFTTAFPIVDQVPVGFTTRTLNIPINTTISSVNVFNNLTHAYLSDVQTDISSPQNPTTFVKLLNRSCTNTNGTLNLKFSNGGATINCTNGATLQTVSPAEDLTVFNGQNPQGTWTFRVYDNFAADTGTMNSWGVEVCSQTLTLATIDNILTDFAIYPNPNKGNFTIKFDNNTSNEIKVNVYDMRGRIIFENNYSIQVTFNENIQLNNAQAGVYLVSVTDGNQKVVKRIVVE